MENMQVTWNMNPNFSRVTPDENSVAIRHKHVNLRFPMYSLCPLTYLDPILRRRPYLPDSWMKQLTKLKLNTAEVNKV